jgi:hypothetical protein
MERISITILGLDSEDGRSLVEQLKEDLMMFLKDRGYDTSINVVYNGEQYDMLKASMADDLVIFDASIEKNEFGSWDSNYAAATASPCALDNILVVSRTRLPINFSALRTNVPELGQNDKDDAGCPITRFENDMIIEWIRSEVEQMLSPFKLKDSETLPPRIPVSKDLKCNLPPFEQLGSVDKSFYDNQERRMIDSLDYMAKIKKKGAFISYRSYYYRNKYHGKTAQDLVQLIKDYHGDNDYPVTIYAEGDIAFQFMTEQRRWFVESFVDHKMRNMDEVWIFDTDNSDGYGYYDSWWTQGEIISLMYMKANGFSLPKIYVYYYDETQKEMVYKMKDESFIPDLTEEVNHELAQYFANAEGANEGMKNMRDLREKDPLYQRLAYLAIKQMQEQFLQTEMMNQVMEGNDFNAFLSSIYAHVYDKSFTENRIVYHPNKENIRHYSIDSFRNPQFIKNFMHINSVRDDGKYRDEIASRGFYSVSPEEMKEIESSGVWNVPNSNDVKKIKKSALSQFQWWPIRKGVRTGPNNVLIEEIINWEFEQ